MNEKDIQVARERLLLESQDINQVSDKLNDQIRALEEGLKSYNLGIAAFTPLSGDFELGYGRLANKWGIIIVERRTLGGVAEREWYFQDAPRSLRIEAIDHLPQLIEALIREAKAMTLRIVEATQVAWTVANAMREASEASRKGDEPTR